MKTRASVLLLNLPFIVSLATPAKAEDLDHLLTGYALTSWNDVDGRPLGSINAIVPDREGYLWVGADAGLFRFDGSRFTGWEVIGDTPLPASGVRALRVRRDGSLWVGLADGGGVRRIRDGRLLRDEGLQGHGSVTDLVEDHDGAMWAISDRMVYAHRGDAWQEIALPWTSPEGLALGLYVSTGGDLWVGTRWGVARRSKGAESFEIVSNKYVWGFSEDSGGTLWMTDVVAGFSRVVSEKSTRRHPLEGAGYQLMHDKKGSLWVATLGEGLWRLPATKAPVPVVERAALRTGLSSDSVQSLAEDGEGNIWVGTTGGLHRLTERKLTPVDNIGFVVVAEPADQGRMWLGTTNGLIRIGAGLESSSRERTGPAAPDIRTLHTDPQGILWVGATDGLWQFARGRLERVTLPGRPQMLVRWMAPDPRGGLWLGDGDWLFRFDGKGLVPFDAPGASQTQTRIDFAQGDKSGRTWVGFAGGRVGFIDERGRLHDVGAMEGFTGDRARTINTVLEDRQGIVWIGGSGGLIRMTQGRVTTLTRDNGLPGNRVWAIVEDLQDRLWLSMDRGLVRLDRSEIDKAVENHTYRMQYRLYDPLDGLAGSAIGLIGSVRASDGTLWFVQGGGVTRANPNHLLGDHALAPGPVRIAAAVANETRFIPTPQSSFPPGTRRLEIRYTTPTLTSSNKVRFRYRLDGVDTDWIDAGTRRTAFYTNLSPRNYRFRVEAGVEGGTWTASPAAWDFTIQPMFHETGWFYALCVGAIVLSVGGMWRVRLGIVQRRFSLALAERARLSREIHDTLLQSLVGVALQVDDISNNLGPSSSSARTQLIRIRRQVEAYIRDARQSILDLRSPVLETQDLASALREFGRNAVADKNVRFVSTITGTLRQCPPKVENQLLRVGQEAITNAVRHADAARIRLELKFEGDSVTLRVTDDGRGFNYDSSTLETENHYGLTTMRERAQELGGQFNITTVVGRGTAVEAVVPTSLVALEEMLAEL